MERISKSLIEQMGGTIVQKGHMIAADYWVYYKRLEKHDYPPD